MVRVILSFLFADDTVLVSESEKHLARLLSEFHSVQQKKSDSEWKQKQGNGIGEDHKFTEDNPNLSGHGNCKGYQVFGEHD